MARDPELERGSKLWNRYAALLVDDGIEELEKLQEKFMLHRRDKAMEGDVEGVEYTDMQLGCIADALAARGVRRR